MKIQLEDTTLDPNHSFSIMVNPKMSDFYFWHFHPAIELVYIDGCSGTRQVGEHDYRAEDDHERARDVGTHRPKGGNPDRQHPGNNQAVGQSREHECQLRRRSTEHVRQQRQS